MNHQISFGPLSDSIARSGYGHLSLKWTESAFRLRGSPEAIPEVAVQLPDDRQSTPSTSLRSVNAAPLIVSLGAWPATQGALSLTLHAVNPCCILNRMVQYCQTRFDVSFGALADATRRGVLEQLGRADASITALAEKFHMTLTGMKKHVGVLEQAELVTTEKVGRVRTCKLGLRGLQEEAAWIERHRQLWSARFDELDIVVEELKRKEKANGRKKRK